MKRCAKCFGSVVSSETLRCEVPKAEIENCSEYDSEGTRCISCDRGWGLAGSACKKCEEGCAVCDGEGKVCEACFGGKVPSEGSCVAPKEGEVPKLCDVFHAKIGMCLECVDGLALQGSDCAISTRGCLVAGESANKCRLCRPGFYLNGASACIANAEFGQAPGLGGFGAVCAGVVVLGVVFLVRLKRSESDKRSHHE